MYSMLLRMMYGDDAPRFTLWNMALKSKRTVRAKPPFYARETIRFNNAELDVYWNRLRGILTDMARKEDELAAGKDPIEVCYPVPTGECSWKCSLFPICHLFDDPRSDVQHILDDRWTKGDPYDYYPQMSVTPAE
jgi:hypothetical protein